MSAIILPAARLWRALNLGAALLFGFSIPTSHAALTLNNTRIVFDSDKRSTSVVVRNPSNSTYAVQAWVNTEVDDDASPVPFLPTPQLFQLSPQKEQQIQINLLPSDLPADRESLFFFNIQEIPQVNKNAGNVLNIALRTRIKLFYRPHQIKGSPAAQLKTLKFSFHENAGTPELRVENPTPFHITFIRMEVSSEGQRVAPMATDMVKPYSSLSYPLPGIKPTPDLRVRFSTINDFGGNTEPVTLPVSVAR